MYRALIALALLFALPAPCIAKDWKAAFARVKDGDTVLLLSHTVFDLPVSIRLISSSGGIDTPEKDGPCAAEREGAARAAEFTRDLIERGGMQGTLRGVRVDKYGGRYLAQIIVRVDGKSINIGDELLRAKLAVIYNGGTRRDWCTPNLPFQGEAQ
jgi:endonuclease YncB( thermonuclease family)